jgi:hypothetical protein
MLTTNLHAASACPNDLLLLLEAPVQQVHLHREGVLLDVAVKIL